MRHSHTINRRTFLQQSGVTALLAGLMLYKPTIAKVNNSDHSISVPSTFSPIEKVVLKAVQSHLFPADGDGPSAADINGLEYLDLTLNEAKNIEEGDRSYIIKGITWLEKTAIDNEHKEFIKLSTARQYSVIQILAESKKGDSWLSLLVYYLLEALLLDPAYGGNTNEIGWAWLGHKAGFPRPSKTKNYHHYLSRAS